jgi:uncharacterized protein YwgA
MSSGFQNKMYNYEVAPPAGVWEKITAELEESELSCKFPSRLHNILIAPPAFVWQRIATLLDDSALVNDYAEKLSVFEVAPPVTVWDKIKTSLDTKYEAAVPEHRKFSSVLKYATAAAIIGFLAWGGIQLFTNKSGETTVAKQETSQANKNSEISSTNQPVNIPAENIGHSDIAAALDEARNDAALEASKKTYAKLDVAVTRSKIKNAASFFFAADSYEPGTRGLGIEPEESPSIDISNRYIILMTPDGNIIRMSKKLRELVCCVSGEEQDKDCIDQMKKWREKIANPSANHSSSNFMDILGLINSLQDN